MQNRTGKPLVTLLLVGLLAGFSAGAAYADITFQARRMTRNDVPLGKGQCDIRLRVDGEVEVSVQLDRVQVRTLSGRDPVDAGSECNEPIPTRLLQGFNFETLDGRGDIRLLSAPDRQSGFRSVVRIRDSQGGDGRYHFRLSWQLDGGGQGRPGYGGGYGTPRRNDPYGDDRYGTDPYGNDDRYGNDRDGYGQRGSRMNMDEAIRVCTQSVRAAVRRDYNFSDVRIRDARLDNRAGRNDTIVGDATGHRGRNTEEFVFACSVNFNNGNVRNVDVRRR